MRNTTTRPALRIREFAEVVALDPGTVRKLIANGEIAAFRIGNSWRIPAAELDRLTHVPAA